MQQQSNRAVGLGMAGIGGILVVVSFLVAEGYWFLLTGSAFVLVGLVQFFLFGREATSDEERGERERR